MTPSSDEFYSTYFAQVILLIVTSPVIKFFSYLQREKELERIRVKSKTEPQVKQLKTLVHEVGRVIGLRKLLVHNYYKRKASGELSKLRKIFQRTSDRLMKINIKAKDADEMEELFFSQLEQNEGFVPINGFVALEDERSVCPDDLISSNLDLTIQNEKL
jgi:hypothetical protein